MPKQPPAPKRAPAIPMGATFPTAQPVSVKAPAATKANPDNLDAGGPFFFYAFMALVVLGVAAVGYALLSM